MKNNEWLKNLVYLLLIGVLFCIGGVLLYKHYYMTNIDYRVNFWLVALIHLVFCVMVGVVIGLENFLNHKKKVGKWKINIPKLIVLGIPFMLLSIPSIFNYFASILLPDKLYNVATLMNNYVLIISEIVFGYTLITSFYKDNSENKSI